MKIRYLLNRLWLPVSIVLVIACSSRKEKEPVTQPAQTIEMPKPGVENQQQTDSLKKVIDAERARRRKNQ